MDREWREASDMRTSLASLLGIVIAAALLRCWHLTAGWMTPEEGTVIGPVLQLIHTGSYRPPTLAQPTMPIYLQTFVAIAHFIWGAIAGRWRSVEQMGPSQVIGWGRAFSAMLGILVIPIVYQVGIRWGARHGLLAAGLMAVMPTHVAVSREMGQGAPLTFFASLALLLSLTATERGGWRRFAAAGAVAGFAAASHYAGVIVALVPLLAAWMADDEQSTAVRMGCVATAIVLAFVMATPLSVLDLPAFLNGVGAAAAPAGAGVAQAVDLIRQLLHAMQWPGVMLAFAGTTLGIVRAITGPGHTRWTLLVSFPVIFFSAVAWHGASSETILLALLPATTVLAATAVISGVSLLRRFEIPRPARTALIAALTVAAVLPPAVFSIDLIRQARLNVSARADRGR